MALIAAGLLGALRHVWRRGVGTDAQARHDTGRAISLGLEALVVADIVRTVASTPTLDGVTVLAVVVAIRTFLSWSVALELKGRWPRQRTSTPDYSSSHNPYLGVPT